MEQKVFFMHFSSFKENFFFYKLSPSEVMKIYHRKGLFDNSKKGLFKKKVFKKFKVTPNNPIFYYDYSW